MGWVGLGGGGGVGWVGLGWVGGGGIFFFYSLFFILFVGWVAIVLTSLSCNLGIDNFDSRQVPILIQYKIIDYSIISILIRSFKTKYIYSTKI